MESDYHIVSLYARRLNLDYQFFCKVIKGDIDYRDELKRYFQVFVTTVTVTIKYLLLLSVILSHRYFYIDKKNDLKEYALRVAYARGYLVRVTMDVYALEVYLCEEIPPKILITNSKFCNNEASYTFVVRRTATGQVQYIESFLVFEIVSCVPPGRKMNTEGEDISNVSILEFGTKLHCNTSELKPTTLTRSEFQSLGRAIVKEDEYEEVRWDGIVSIVSWRERVFRLWWEERITTILVVNIYKFKELSRNRKKSVHANEWMEFTVTHVENRKHRLLPPPSLEFDDTGVKHKSLY
ncbi:hypothetical protein ANN_15614 [Periplaneta americana]|uniref:Uncharacterized protein n=1 Tax=Periplaneta americana TaxID=6978 RepID=A0ABQ8SHU9_PERAM|nr:hypothetical protein ANN_15614 [Periplaneta americana]